MIECVNKLILLRRWKEQNDAKAVIGKEAKVIHVNHHRGICGLLQFELCPHFCVCLDMIMQRPWFLFYSIMVTGWLFFFLTLLLCEISAWVKFFMFNGTPCPACEGQTISWLSGAALEQSEGNFHKLPLLHVFKYLHLCLYFVS